MAVFESMTNGFGIVAETAAQPSDGCGGRARTAGDAGGAMAAVGGAARRDAARFRAAPSAGPRGSHIHSDRR